MSRWRCPHIRLLAAGLWFACTAALFAQTGKPVTCWTPVAEAAFKKAMAQGTVGWIGFHHASLLGKFDGFESVEDLLGIARHGSGENVYLIRFHYLPPGAWDTPGRRH